MNLNQKADFIRQEVIRIAAKHKLGHIAPSLSCVDILCGIFYGRLPEFRFILSKAHGCYGYYAILADLGRIPQAAFESFSLSGCSERHPEYGIEAGCGSLGHGLPIAAGLAYATRSPVMCLAGDGEMQEGSCWEAIQFIYAHSLPVLLMIDQNGLQAMDWTDNVLPQKYPLKHRLQAFGLPAVETFGHDAGNVSYLVRKSMERLPAALVFETVKGYGMKCAENVPRFHFRQLPCIASAS